MPLNYYTVRLSHTVGIVSPNILHETAKDTASQVGEAMCGSQPVKVDNFVHRLSPKTKAAERYHHHG